MTAVGLLAAERPDRVLESGRRVFRAERPRPRWAWGGLRAKECLVMTLAGDTSQPHPPRMVKRGPPPRMGGCDHVDHGKELGAGGSPRGRNGPRARGRGAGPSLTCGETSGSGGGGSLGSQGGAPVQGTHLQEGKSPRAPSFLPEGKSWWLPGGFFWSSLKSRKILFYKPARPRLRFAGTQVAGRRAQVTGLRVPAWAVGSHFPPLASPGHVLTARPP